MKNVEETVVCIVDYGYFTSMAEKLGQVCKKVYYYTPYESEYQDIQKVVFGTGIKNVERLDDPLDPEYLNEIDWFCFLDIGFAHLQKHLLEIGKPVWGSFDATDYEIYRTYFLETIEKLGLPYAPYEIKEGLTELSKHLETVKDKWIKIDRYRGNMETWHHIDYDHSQRVLEGLAVKFGGLKEAVTFIIQDSIHTQIELGYDGWFVDGIYPSKSYQGYEGKNKIYIGSLLPNEQIPKPILEINKAIAPLLLEKGYRNFMATEIRVKDGKPYFTDPTFRMAGQSQEHLLESCGNLADVMWNGSNGISIEPKFLNKYALSATMIYDDGSDSETWATINIPEKVKRWVKPCHYGIYDGVYNFPPEHRHDLGVVIGVGNTIKGAFKHLKENRDALKDEPISFETDGFFDLLEAIRNAQKKGMKFTDDAIPTDEELLEYIM